MCQHFTLKQYNATYNYTEDVLDVVWVADRKGCVTQCQQSNNCVTFVTMPSFNNGLMCYTGVYTDQMKSEPGAIFYTVYMG